MAATPPTRAASWLAVLLASGLLETYCGHTRYDLRASARAGCTTLKPPDNACIEPSGGCLSADAVRWLSPRPLALLAGHGGPLLTWIPLLLGGAHKSPMRSTVGNTLVLAATWYLGLIGLVRHTHLLLANDWDPSGHVFVYGAQLVPRWHLLRAEQRAGANSSASHPLARAWLLVWEGVLWYLSSMTAIAFHTLSETAAAAALTVLLVCLLEEGGGRTLPDRVVGGRCHVSQALSAAAASWALFTAVGWWGARPASFGVLVGFLLYDAFLWLLLLLLLRVGTDDGAAAAEMVGDGGAAASCADDPCACASGSSGPSNCVSM